MYNPKPKFCQIIEQSSIALAVNKPVSIFQLTGAFFVLIIGFTLSLIPFISECVLGKVCRKLN